MIIPIMYVFLLPFMNKIEDKLVGGWPTPLKNMSSSVGMMKFPIYGNKQCSKLPTSKLLRRGVIELLYWLMLPQHSAHRRTDLLVDTLWGASFPSDVFSNQCANWILQNSYSGDLYPRTIPTISIKSTQSYPLSLPIRMPTIIQHVPETCA
jgi:hypothetical protein